LTLRRDVRYDVHSMGRRRWRWGLVAVLWALPAAGDAAGEAVKMARKRFGEGVAAADAGDYEAARIAFQQAYALKPHPSVLRNLGEAELKTGHHLEAARHLTEFVRETTFGTPEDREHAKKALAKAQARVGRLAVEVDVAGAEITIDGESIGRSPLSAEPAYVEAGRRIVRIEKEGYQLYEQAEVLEPGRTTQLKIMLKANTAERPLTGAASLSRAAAAPAIDASPSAPPDLGPPPPGLRPREASGARTAVLISSGALTVVSAAAWLGFALHSASLGDQAADARDRVGAQPPADACVRENAACASLRDVSDRRVTATRLAIAGAVGTGVFGAVLLSAWQLWPSRGGAGVSVRPDLASGRAGLYAAGTF
jgi:hypothetical protein